MAIGVISALVAYILHRVRARREGEASGPVILLNLDKPPLDKPETPLRAEESPAEPVQVPAPAPPSEAGQSAGYTIQTLQRRPSLALDLARIALIVLSLVVAAGFILIILPQPAVDSMSQGLQARSGVTPKQEMISLLYLGDEVKDREFHVRGVVRNITAQPIEKLDALIRLYGSDGNLLETAIVRMDKETLAPDEAAEFHLTYPNYNMQFSSYAVDFKWRQGDLVPYKDLRGSRTQS
ncbi:MAG TPA: FxLYD domain-containing protein [Acidobacteriota bacterium]|nr:FxLYD domain-containing protein [Acidobacteriota bacterium]